MGKRINLFTLEEKSILSAGITYILIKLERVVSESGMVPLKLF